MRLTSAVLSVLALPLSGVASATTAPPDSVQVARLAALGRLWATAGYFHPYLARLPIDWDSALVVAIPRVKAAGTAAAYQAAVASMLGALADPATRVERPSPETAPVDEEPSGSWLPDSIWLVRLHSPAALADFLSAVARLEAMDESVGRARGVVFDLRLGAPPEDPTALPYILESSGLLRRFIRDTLRVPSARGRLYAGLPPAAGQTTSGGYFSGWYTMQGPLLFPADTGRRIPLAFVTNHRAQLPQEALGLIAAGRAALVLEGSDGDAFATETIPVPLADGLVARVRLTELVRPGGFGWTADTVLPAGAPKQIAIETALHLLRGGPRSRAAPAVPAEPAALPQRGYDESALPSPELRLLAAFRMWGVVRWFFPYKDIMKENWDSVLTRFIPRLEAAGDSLEYAFRVAEMWNHIRDSHGFVDSDVLRNWIGRAWAPVNVRMIQGLPTVTSFSHDSAAKKSGIRIGDAVVAIDGQPVARRIAQLRRAAFGGTPQAIERDLMVRLLRGRDSSTAQIQVRGGDGRIRTITLRRSLAFTPNQGRSGPVLRMLRGNIGYADLDRLEGSMVDSMFRMFRDTRALIFDMRGYPKGTAWLIAPRLTRQRNVAAARFDRPTPMGRDTTEVTTTSFVQTLPAPLGAAYRGRTVMLIDERTQSQAEHTGLFFKAANGTVFVGAPTAGANGDVTSFLVPGKIRLMFSGQAVRYSDGTQLQRVGLRPDVLVRPTIRGIRAGRDEVLERAMSVVDRLSHR